MSRPLPYSPMHAPQKNVTQEDMWNVLAKHSSLPVKTPEAGQTPKAELRSQIEWAAPVKTGESAGYILSLCGRFSITKSPSQGKPMYMAWLRKIPPTDSVILGVRDVLKEAQHLCVLEERGELRV